MPQAYVAGAYTATTQDETRENIVKALKVGIKLAERGYLPIVPHASMPHDTPWMPAMERCFLVISKLTPGQDIVHMMEGWENSRGAKTEKLLAHAMGLEVWHFRTRPDGTEVMGLLVG
jgi:hypothetical protein